MPRKIIAKPLPRPPLEARLPITFRSGRKPPHPEHTHPRVKFAQIRTATALPPHPPLVDYVTRVADWPMYGNADWSDCVLAAAGHIIEAATTYGIGTTVKITDTDVLHAYSAVTGFDPTAGPSGSNPTDQGTVIQDALSYWRKVGIGGHKILAYAQVNVKNAGEVAEALYLFGHLELGIDFPSTAMDQFNAGQPWDVVPGASIVGGHAVNLGLVQDTTSTPFPKAHLLGVNARGNYEIISWGRVQELTPAFWDAYVTEAWIVITPEWEQATGGSPAGIDKARLGALFTQLTGQPSPFATVPTPGPDPAPAPVPPAPVDDVWPEITAWLDRAWSRLRSLFSGGR